MKCLCPISDLEIHCFAMTPIDSRMYVLLTDGTNAAVIIDPCVSAEADDLLAARGITAAAVFLTHEHFDHISGVNHLRRNIGVTVIASAACASALPDPRKNLSRYFETLFCLGSEETRRAARDRSVTDYSCEADISFGEAYTHRFGDHEMRAIVTPGHSRGSAIVFADHDCVFTGDSLLRVPVVTRLPGGNRRDYEQMTLPILRGIPSDMIVFPGHGCAGAKACMHMGSIPQADASVFV